MLDIKLIPLGFHSKIPGTRVSSLRQSHWHVSSFRNQSSVRQPTEASFFQMGYLDLFVYARFS